MEDPPSTSIDDSHPLVDQHSKLERRFGWLFLCVVVTALVALISGNRNGGGQSGNMLLEVIRDPTGRVEVRALQHSGSSNVLGSINFDYKYSNIGGSELMPPLFKTWRVELTYYAWPEAKHGLSPQELDETLAKGRQRLIEMLSGRESPDVEFAQILKSNRNSLRQLRWENVPSFIALLVCPVFLAAAAWTGFLILRSSRMLKLAGRGLCPFCAYDLRGLTADKCPECGKPKP